MGKEKKEKKSTRRGPAADYSEATGGARALADALDGKPQAQAARELGVTAAFFNHLLRGRKKPGLDLAIKIRDEFGVAVDVW